MKKQIIVQLSLVAGLVAAWAAAASAGDAPDSTIIPGEQYQAVTDTVNSLHGRIENRRRDLDTLAAEISRLKQEKKNGLFGNQGLDRKLKASQVLALELDSLEQEARRWDDSLAVLQAAVQAGDTLTTDSLAATPPEDTGRVTECRTALEKVRHLILKKKQEREEAARTHRQLEEQVQLLEKNLLFVSRTEQLENDERGYLKTREDYENELEFLKRRWAERKEAETNAALELKKLEQEEMRLVKMLEKLP